MGYQELLVCKTYSLQGLHQTQDTTSVNIASSMYVNHQYYV